MPSAACQPQLDLFEVQSDPSRNRRGRPHIPTPEQKLIAYELKKSGATWPIIARALGVCVNTVARHYFPSNLARPPKGRRRHIPTKERREIVRRAILGGMRLAAIAKLIGVSLPTLRLHYRDELQLAASNRAAHCSHEK